MAVSKGSCSATAKDAVNDGRILVLISGINGKMMLVMIGCPQKDDGGYQQSIVTQKIGGFLGVEKWLFGSQKWLFGVQKRHFFAAFSISPCRSYI